MSDDARPAWAAPVAPAFSTPQHPYLGIMQPSQYRKGERHVDSIWPTEKAATMRAAELRVEEVVGQ